MQIEAGQVAVVTGGTSGIGLALAEAFARRGLGVVIADVREDSLAPAETSLRDLGARTLAVRTDVTVADEVDALARATLERFGRVDIVCNNAGVVGRPGPMWEQEPATWRWVLDVALMGVVHGIRSFVPHLVRAGSGHVLNTASVGGLMPLPMLAPYNAAKHAVVGITETLSAELAMAHSGVGASVLCPARVATPLAETSAAVQPAGAVAPEAAEPDGRGQVTVLTSGEVARVALAGIEAGRLHILTHADSGPAVRGRVERLLADLPTLP